MAVRRMARSCTATGHGAVLYALLLRSAVVCTLFAGWEGGVRSTRCDIVSAETPHINTP